MKYVKGGVVAAAVLLLWLGVARAEREPQYASPGPDGAPRPQPKPPTAAPRPGTFAAASIPNIRRMSPEQRESERQPGNAGEHVDDRKKRYWHPRCPCIHCLRNIGRSPSCGAFRHSTHQPAECSATRRTEGAGTFGCSARSS